MTLAGCAPPPEASTPGPTSAGPKSAAPPEPPTPTPSATASAVPDEGAAGGVLSAGASADALRHGPTLRCAKGTTGSYALPAAWLSEHPELRALLPQRGSGIGEKWRFPGAVTASLGRATATLARGYTIWFDSPNPEEWAKGFRGALESMGFKSDGLFYRRSSDGLKAAAFPVSSNALFATIVLQHTKTPVPLVQRALADRAKQHLPERLTESMLEGIHELDVSCVMGEERAQLIAILPTSTWAGLISTAKMLGFVPERDGDTEFFQLGDPAAGGRTLVGVDVTDATIDVALNLGPNPLTWSGKRLAAHNRALRERF
jgi:hypothetical protein